MIALQSIKAKILLILTLVLSVTVVITLNISNHLVGGYHQKNQRESLNRAWHLSNTMLNSIKTSTRHRAELIGVLPILGTVVENKDISTIADITNDYQKQLDLDILEVYNISGSLLTSTQPPTNKHYESINLMVEDALDNGELVLSYVHYNNHLHYIASTPIGLAHDPTGALVVGTTINQSFLDQVKKQANVDVSLVHKNHSYLSTLEPEAVKELNLSLQKTDIQSLAEAQESIVEINNNLLRVRKITNVAGDVICYIVIMYSLEESKSLLQGLQNSIISGGFITLIVSLIFSYLFVKIQVISPIDRLVGFIFRIEKSGDKSLRFQYDKQDEISTISHALNRLLEGQETLVSELEQSNRHLKIEISERIINEERIKKLSMAVEQSPAAIMITNKKGEIEYVNYKFSQMTGFQAEEIIGKDPKVLNAKTTDPNVVGMMWGAITQGTEWSGEMQNRTKGGVTYFERVHLCPILTPIGEISHFVLISEDVTEQKKFQEELIRAKDEAQAANVAKSEFLANMSHEIRTPMNAVLGMSHLVLETELDTEQKELLTIAVTAGESLLVLINDILDLSKIESGKFELIFEEFSTFNLIQSIGDIFEHKFAEKQVDFVITVDPSIPKVIVGDLLRIRQVLVNLVGNANKFTSEGAVTVTVALQEMQGDDLTLKFQVKDTGIGIKKEGLDRIFNSFTQVHSTKAKDYGGTGLGLSICQRLIKVMGGQIWATSELGQGSDFYFTIKVKTFCDPEATKAVETKNIQDLACYKILVVEETTTTQELIKKTLKETNCQVQIAVNGYEALIYLEKEEFDLVLMDVHMPRMSGIETAMQIRKEESVALNRNIPIIAVISNDPEEDRQECLDVGMNHFITKPIQAKPLLDIICHTMEGCKS